MSKTLIVTVDAIETITKTAEIVVRVPDSISNKEVEELLMSLDLRNHPSLDWGMSEYQDFEIHAAKVTGMSEEIGTPDVVIKRVGNRFVPEMNR